MISFVTSLTLGSKSTLSFFGFEKSESAGLSAISSETFKEVYSLIDVNSLDVNDIILDKKYRIFFRFNSKNSVRFLVIGPHDWIYKLKF